MKREYHLTISRTDRIYLVGLVMALLGWELIKFVIPTPDEKINPESITYGSPEKPHAEINFTSKRTVGNADPEHHPDEAPYGKEGLPVTRESMPEPIAIMDAKADQLIKVGFHPRIARNIEKYISAGGQIRDAAGLYRIYGMDSAQLLRVLPNIVFPENPSPKQSETVTGNEYSPHRIDLNTADSATLDALPGIGPVLATRILRFRDALGGFHTIQQLEECYGLTPETMERIVPRLTLETPHQKMAINSIDLVGSSHPYLPKKIARVISAYREQHRPFTSLTDLRNAYPPDTSWCDKLIPYIRFD